MEETIDLESLVKSIDFNEISQSQTDFEPTFVEPLLTEDISRFTTFPIKYDDLWGAYKQHEAALWTAEEIDYSADISDWNKLSEDEKYFIENILAFFAGADGIVMENLTSNFVNEVQWAEARAFYAIQTYIEQVHSQTYSMLIDTYITDSERKIKLFNGIETIPCIKRKADWAMKWMNPETASFAERLIAFAVVEGIFFSGSFCAIFWLKSRGKMVKALGKSNELIARDEGMHTRFAITLYQYLEKKVSKEDVYKIFKEAVAIEKEFICESLPCDLIGMNKKLMTQYIKYVADYWVKKLGYAKIYYAKNPFSFMDMNGIDGKTNFFEQRVTEYQRASSVSTAESRKFNLEDDDF